MMQPESQWNEWMWKTKCHKEQANQPNYESQRMWSHQNGWQMKFYGTPLQIPNILKGITPKDVMDSPTGLHLWYSKKSQKDFRFLRKELLNRGNDPVSHIIHGLCTTTGHSLLTHKHEHETWETVPEGRWQWAIGQWLEVIIISGSILREMLMNNAKILDWWTCGVSYEILDRALTWPK